MKLYKIILKNLLSITGYLRVVTTDIIFPGTIPAFPLCEIKRRLEWGTGNITQNMYVGRKKMYEGRKYFITAYLYFSIWEETFSIMAMQHSSAHSKSVTSSVSHTREDVPCSTYTTSWQNKIRKQSAINKLYCFLLSKLTVSLEVRASQSHLHQGLQFPLRLCSMFNYYLD